MSMIRSLPLLTLLLTGCGPSSTDVVGSVKYQGKTVVYGMVMLVGKDGLPKYGNIEPDGTFRITGMVLGPARVSVSSPPPPGANVKPVAAVGRDEGFAERRTLPSNVSVNPAVVAGWFELPQKYNDPSTSELTFEVEPGKRLDLDLK